MLLARHAEAHEDDQAQATASDERKAALPGPSPLRASPESVKRAPTATTSPSRLPAIGAPAALPQQRVALTAPRLR